MALQTSIQKEMAPAFPGQWYDIADTEAVSRIVTDSALAFGVVALMSEQNDSFACRLPDHGGYIAGSTATTDADNLSIGIVMAHATVNRVGLRSLEKPLAGGDSGFLQVGESASLATHGRIWVPTEGATTAGQKVYYRHTLTNNAADPQDERLGICSDTASIAHAELYGAKWLYSKADGEMNVVILNGSQFGVANDS